MDGQRRNWIIGIAFLIFVLTLSLSEAKSYKARERNDDDVITIGDKPGGQEKEGNEKGVSEIVEGVAANATAMIRKDDPCRECSKLHRGILHRVVDPGKAQHLSCVVNLPFPENFAKGCLVYGVLYCNTFDLYRGQVG